MDADQVDIDVDEVDIDVDGAHLWPAGAL
jgi:hypothetical protein